MIIALTSLHVGGVKHTVGKFSTRLTTLLETSLQSEVCTKSYGAPKSQEYQFWEFWNSHLGVPRQNDIWMLVCGQAQSIIWGGRWWFPPSWGRGESYESMFACGSSMHQKHSNYALTTMLFGLCRSVWVINANHSS